MAFKSIESLLFVLITGGLGPTKDDITKHTLCEYFQTELEINVQVLEQITAFFAGRGLPMLESNRLQAALPKACEVLINTRGTASGMWFERSGCVFVSMPGVPYEMKGLMEDEVMPRVSQHFERPSIVHRTILTQGVGESFLAESIKDWEDSLAEKNIKLAYLPAPGMVRLRLSSYGGASVDQQHKDIAEKEVELKGLIGEHIYGYDKETLAQAVGELLKKKGMTLSAAESCTGGYIAHQVTSVAGSSSYFIGATVAYDPAVKIKQLGVSAYDIETHGVVSQQVVEAMARGAQQLFGTDYSLATTGVAGPEGGTENTPVGTVWIACATPNGVISQCLKLGKSRERNISMASNAALNLIRKEIIQTNT
jgi:nicotinamide-nucleotide amidase